MRILLTICLLLISSPAIASAQPRAEGPRQEAEGRRQTAGSRIQAPARKMSLTRSQIKEAERWLTEMGYWTGPIDGRFDPATRSALIAFQKWEGRPVSGQLTLDEIEAMRISASPKARELGYAHVEVDLDRQVLMLVNDEGGVRVLPVSTGSDKPFMDQGQQSIAYTPRGRFVVYDKTFGWENGDLGSVYYANYISGGVAIHGFRTVPTQPASHGCIRIPMFAAREVSKLMPVGTIVLVYDQVSFVSGKAWVENPELKQAALADSVKGGFADYTDYDHAGASKTNSKSLSIKKVRSRTIRTE